jgi:hypothetical protein
MWVNELPLFSPESDFLSRSAADQMKTVEEFILRSLDTARLIVLDISVKSTA